MPTLTNNQAAYTSAITKAVGPSYAPELPLTMDSIDGAYTNIHSLENVARQNLKMLILTNPGERVGDIGFGAGIRNFLFELDSTHLYAEINKAITSQVQTYLPYINIKDMIVRRSDADLDTNSVSLSIVFAVVPLNYTGELHVDFVGGAGGPGGGTAFI